MAGTHDHNRTIQTLIEGILQLPMGASLDALLLPAHQMEEELRRLFATSPDDQTLADPHVGLIDVFNTNQELWKIIGRPSEDQNALNNKYIMPVGETSRQPYGSPCAVSSFAEFQFNWAIFTHQVLSKIKWEHVVAAGGSVLACLTPSIPVLSAKDLNKSYKWNYPESDIDLFLWGLTASEAEEKMCGIYNSVCAAVRIWDVVCVRKANVISIHSSYPFRPVQIILRLYKSPAEVLAGFDVDSACCAYDGKTVWTNWRSLAACVRQCNTVDITRRSPSYELRLAKYASRGFEIYFPSLSRERIDPSIFDNLSPKSPNGLARLLILEYIKMQQTATLPGGFAWKEVLIRGYARVGPGRQLGTDLQSNNYDILWVIPYGPKWDADVIYRSVQRLYQHVNWLWRLNNGGRLHRHPLFAGSMRQCIENFCPGCPLPFDEIEQSIVDEEAGKYIRGRVSFFQSNAGRQVVTGSFRPIDVGDWEESAYIRSTKLQVHGQVELAEHERANTSVTVQVLQVASVLVLVSAILGGTRTRQA